MKFLKTFFSKIVSKIKSLWSSLVGGKKPSGTEPLLQNSAPTPEPTPVDPNLIVPNLIVQAQNPMMSALPLESYIALRGTCKTLFGAFKLTANEEAILKLATHVLRYRPSEVTKILEDAKDAKDDTEKLKQLLTNSVTMPVTLPSGLLFNGLTPFQAALCTRNTTLCKEFKKYFAQIPDGLAIMQGQINQIFPNGDVEAYIEKQKADAEAFKTNTLRPLIATIKAASLEDVQTMLEKKQSNSDLGKAITRFREEIKTLCGNEPVHNPFYLQEAHNLYDECFLTFRTQDHRALFCIQGIGCIQCYSPACDLQAFAQVVKEQKPFQGSFKFTHVGDSAPHLKINVKDFSGLGFDYWAGSSAGYLGSCFVPLDDGEVAVGCTPHDYSRFLSSKNIRYYEFCAGSAAASDQFRNGM